MRSSRIVTLLLLWSVPLVAQLPYDTWNARLRAVNSQMTDSIASFGVRTDATGDFDNAYDIPRPPRAPSGNYLEVYFPHSGGSYPPILGSKYAVDYQGPVDPAWSLSIESSVTGTVTLSWDSSYLDAIERRVQLFLVDLGNGTVTNMRTHGSYQFAYAAKRDFQIVGAVKIDLTYLMEGFWSGSSQVADTVKGYLAQAAPPYALTDSATVALSASGTGMLVFAQAPSGSYYLVVRHRNHLELWSASAAAWIKGTSTLGAYDFSAAPGTAYGTAPLRAVGGVHVAWGGDTNQDGVVDFLDRNRTWNDRTLSGYQPADCNGDGTVDGTDYTMVLDNRLRVRQRP